MESFYPDELGPELERQELTSNFEDMICAILSGTPDPRLTNQDYD